MTSSSIIAATLLGLGSAVVAPGPIVNATFPKYATQVAPTSATELSTATASAGSILAIYNNVSTALTTTVGPIRGYRNTLFAFPTQSITRPSANTSATLGTISAQTGTRTFYQTTTVLIGATAYASSKDGAVFGSLTNGSSWAICKTTTNTKDCAGGVMSDGQAGTAAVYQAYAGRIMLLAGSTAATGVQTIGAAGKAYQLEFNNDILMASLYHNAYTTTEVTSGVSWCSDWDNKLLAAGTIVPFSATHGLTGRNKCSWVLTAADNTVGPSIKIKSADYLNFFLHYVEWAGTAALPSSAILPAAEAASFFLGTYAAGTNGAQHLNPLTAVGTTWPLPTSTNFIVNGFFTTSSVTNPKSYFAGSLGQIKYFPGLEGDAKDIQTMTIDQMQVKSMYDMVTKTNDMFNTDNGAYEKLRTVYEDAKTAETARLADALKAAFEPVIAIPSRPCAPSRPMAYSGVSLDLGGAAYPATFTLAGTRGTLEVAYTSVAGATSTSATDTKLAVGSVKNGFVFPTGDTGASPNVVGSAGHVFGRLGQGAMTQPGMSAPFAWFGVAAGSLSAMMVSAFPVADADAGLASATKFVRLEASASVWATLDSFKAPGQPGAPTAATEDNAKMLALGAASALVFVTLA